MPPGSQCRNRLTCKRILPLNVLVERRSPPIERKSLRDNRLLGTPQNTAGRKLPKGQPFVITNRSVEVANTAFVTSNPSFVISITRFVIRNDRLRREIRFSKPRIVHSRLRATHPFSRTQHSCLRTLHTQSRTTHSRSGITRSWQHPGRSWGRSTARAVAQSFNSSSLTSVCSLSCATSNPTDFFAVQHHQ